MESGEWPDLRMPANSWSNWDQLGSFALRQWTKPNTLQQSFHCLRSIVTITTALSAPQSCKKTRANQILKINATCMSWIQLHKCISTISYLARWQLVGLKCKSCSSFMVPYRRTSDSLEPLASPQEFWAMCDIPLVYTQIRESHSKHQTVVSGVIQVKACQTPVYHIFFYTVFYCDTNWQSQVSIEWRKESLWPRHSSHLTVPDPSRTSTECDLWGLHDLTYSQHIQEVSSHLASMCLSYSALNGRSWHWRQFADPWRPWQIGSNFSSQAFDGTNSINSKAENHANSGNIAYYTFLYYKRQSYCPLLAAPWFGLPRSPTITFLDPSAATWRVWFRNCCTNPVPHLRLPSVPGHAIGNILGQPKERKSWRCDFEDIGHGPWDDVGVEYSWHMWCHGPGQLSKNPLFAPNASLSSLEGDDKEPSCAGEAILAWKSSQSHPLFMRKQWKTMKDNAWQCHSCH